MRLLSLPLFTGRGGPQLPDASVPGDPAAQAAGTASHGFFLSRLQLCSMSLLPSRVQAEGAAPAIFEMDEENTAHSQ